MGLEDSGVADDLNAELMCGVSQNLFASVLPQQNQVAERGL